MILNQLLSRDLLIDAYKFYSRGDARAHEALNIIIKRDDMFNAVKGCLDQALKEEEPNKQKLYVQAACFGKKFQPGVAIKEYPSTCKQIKVMNALRAENIDASASLDTAIDMLMSWKKFELALWIVGHLNVEGEHKIRAKWSENFIDQRQLKDDQVAAEIQKILGTSPSVSYAEIATKAIERHRVQLAIKLIENESHSLKQIPLLLSLKQYDLVLAQALASCDSNLIYMAIFKLKESIPSEIPFLELLKKHKLAYRYYCNFLAISDIQKLIMISHKDNLSDELVWSLTDNRMESALTVAKKARRDIVPQQIENCMKLRKFQQTLSCGPPSLARHSSWMDLSISDTIINLIAVSQPSKAKDVQRRFDVTDKKYRVLEQIASNTLPKLAVPVNSP